MSSPSMAKVIILGNLTKDPDCRRTATGSAVCELSVAVNRRGSNGRDETSFIEIVAWGKTADNCRQYLSKGSCITVEGYLKQERWQDRNTGANRSKLVVVAENVIFLNTGANRRERQQEQYPQAEPEHYDQEPATATEQRPVVDPQYAPEPRRPRFYGDTCSVASPSRTDAQEQTAQDDIPF